MKLTNKLKQWTVENRGIKAASTDDEFKKAIGEAIVDGELTPDELKSLSTTKSDEEANEFSDMLSGLKSSFDEIKTRLDEKDSAKEDEEAKDKEKESAKEEEGKEAEEAKGTKPAGTKGTQDQPSRFSKMMASMGVPSIAIDEETGEEKSFDIRVKDASEQYSSEKTALIYPERTEKGSPHPFAGHPVRDTMTKRAMDTPSELDMAASGAYAKFIIGVAQFKSRNIAFQRLPEHDKNLLMHAMEKMKWGGSSDGGDLADIKDRNLTPREQKALIDDGVSGGLEAAPIVFDDQVIQTPLLNGELYPLVNVVPLDRGRRIEGVATGTVTGSWGGVDDSAISLFNTASYVSAFDTTIFRWEGAIRIGLDFLSDTPIDFGQHVTAQYGERLLEDLDDVIATGNGTDRPEGVTVKSSTTSVNFGGTTSLGNYESLRFGVAKPEHKANLLSSAVFCGSETSYQRARAIPVGASDARRLGGMDYSSYQWMERPYKINESLGNAKIFYAILARYRMYRRRGLTIRTSTEGDTLIRNNELLMVAMARYGGQLERGAVAAVTSTAPA